MLAQGARVAVSGRRLASLQKVVSSHHATGMAVPMDVTQPSQWRDAFEQLNSTWQGVDLIIFCAADYKPLRPWELKSDQVKYMLDVNLAGIYYGLEVVVPGLLTQGHGSLALVGSVAGYMGLPKATVYGPTKAALINLADVLYSELHDKGLGVYLISPGFVKTRLTEGNDFHMPALLTTEAAARAILKGFSKGVFEIHFPKRFSIMLKALQWLPSRLRLRILRTVARNA
jgi:NADP-dependent 3-hydroxy acid dehydrogenase YdfG